MSGRESYVKGLRDLADYIETTNLDLDSIYEDGLRVDLFFYDQETWRGQSRALGGFREKTVEGSFAITRRHFGPHTVEVNISRDKVCDRVLVGEQTIPATSARVEPVYEWRCPDFDERDPDVGDAQIYGAGTR